MVKTTPIQESEGLISDKQERSSVFLGNSSDKQWVIVALGWAPLNIWMSKCVTFSRIKYCHRISLYCFDCYFDGQSPETLKTFAGQQQPRNIWNIAFKTVMSVRDSLWLFLLLFLQLKWYSLRARFVVDCCRRQAWWHRILHSNGVLAVTCSRVSLMEFFRIRAVQQVMRWRSAFWTIT